MNDQIPSLNWLRVFEAAARVENFARAGELLNLSTSAVSQQIKALEKHLGEQLFYRHPRSVELTDAGHAYMPSVRQALRTIEETTAALFGQAKDDTLVLQVTQVLATAWLAPRLTEFSRLYPRIRLHVTSAYRDLDYQRTGAELKILFGPVHRSWGQCDRLFDERIYPVAASAIAEQAKDIDSALGQRLIQIPTHRVNWNQILHNAGMETIPTHKYCYTEDTPMALAMASSGYGIALARSPTTDELVERLELVACEFSKGLKSTEAYYLVFQNVESLSPAANAFRDWLLDQASLNSASSGV